MEIYLPITVFMSLLMLRAVALDRIPTRFLSPAPDSGSHRAGYDNREEDSEEIRHEESVKAK
jgi:hypothetical protein